MRKAEAAAFKEACIKEDIAYQSGDNHHGYLDWWVDALASLDQLDDKKPLTEMLRSDCELSPLAREYLADLIERGVPSPPNRPRKPSYSISEVFMSHRLALGDIAAYRKAGMSKDDALEKAANEHSLNATALRLSLEGRNTSFRRSMKKYY